MSVPEQAVPYMCWKSKKDLVANNAMRTGKNFNRESDLRYTSMGNGGAYEKDSN